MEQPIKRSKAVDSISSLTDNETRKQAILTVSSFGDKMDDNEVDFSDFSKIEEDKLMDLSEFKEITGGFFSGKRGEIKNVDDALEEYLSVRDSTDVEEKFDKFKVLYEVTKGYTGKRSKKMLKFFVQLSLEKNKLQKEIVTKYTDDIRNICDSRASGNCDLDDIKNKFIDFKDKYSVQNNIYPDIVKYFNTYISNSDVKDKIHSIIESKLKVSFQKRKISFCKRDIDFFISNNFMYADLKNIVDSRKPIEDILHLDSNDIKKITDELKDIFTNGGADLKTYILNNIDNINSNIHSSLKNILGNIYGKKQLQDFKDCINIFKGFGLSYPDLENATYNKVIMDNILEVNSANPNSNEVKNMKTDLANVNPALLGGILETGVRIRYTDGSAADELGDSFGNQAVRGHGVGVTWKTEQTPGVFAPKDTLNQSVGDKTSKVDLSNTKATNGLVVVQIGQDEQGTTKKHGSYNMQLHELGHGVDYTLLQSSKLDEINDLFRKNSAKFKPCNVKAPIFWQGKKITDSNLFKDIQAKEKNSIFPDELYGNYYYDNMEEYFAETFSMYNSTKALDRNTAMLKFQCLKDGTYDNARQLYAQTLIGTLPKKILKIKAPITYKFFELLSQLQ